LLSALPARTGILFPAGRIGLWAADAPSTGLIDAQPAHFVAEKSLEGRFRAFINKSTRAT
jgi:hypothetical protein